MNFFFYIFNAAKERIHFFLCETVCLLLFIPFSLCQIRLANDMAWRFKWNDNKNSEIQRFFGAMDRFKFFLICCCMQSPHYWWKILNAVYLIDKGMRVKVCKQFSNDRENFTFCRLLCFFGRRGSSKALKILHSRELSPFLLDDK